VRLAVARVRDSAVATRWSGASAHGAPSDPLPTDPEWARGSLYVDERTRATTAAPADLWRASAGTRAGTPSRWRRRYAAGGAGLRRGRRNPHDLYVGDALDFRRVEELDEGRLLRLRAEMRLPGLAWLEFHVEHDTAERTG
jgi:hypothetical protein